MAYKSDSRTASRGLDVADLLERRGAISPTPSFVPSMPADTPTIRSPRSGRQDSRRSTPSYHHHPKTFDYDALVDNSPRSRPLNALKCVPAPISSSVKRSHKHARHPCHPGRTFPTGRCSSTGLRVSASWALERPEPWRMSTPDRVELSRRLPTTFRSSNILDEVRPREFYNLAAMASCRLVGSSSVTGEYKRPWGPPPSMRSPGRPRSFLPGVSARCSARSAPAQSEDSLYRAARTACRSSTALLRSTPR